jgi:hypothetical protein
VTRKLLPLIALFTASEAVGLIAGEQFFRLFLHTIPAVLLTDFNRGAAHAAFIAYGAGLGVAMFVIALAAVGVDRLKRGGRSGAQDAGRPPV